MRSIEFIVVRLASMDLAVEAKSVKAAAGSGRCTVLKRYDTNDHAYIYNMSLHKIHHPYLSMWSFSH